MCPCAQTHDAQFTKRKKRASKLFHKLDGEKRWLGEVLFSYARRSVIGLRRCACVGVIRDASVGVCESETRGNVAWVLARACAGGG